MHNDKNSLEDISKNIKNYQMKIKEIKEIKYEDDLKIIKEWLEDNNPWSYNDNEEYPFLSKVDENFLIQQNEYDEFLKDVPPEIFKQYSQVFDGNLEDPEVLILGINPRFDPECKGNPHKGRIENPFKDKNIYDAGAKCYYFGTKDNGHIKFPTNKKDTKYKYTQIKGKLALLELFPYATDGVVNFFKNQKINKTFQEYLNLKKLLPSQKWIKVLLAYIIKKSFLKSDSQLKIFLTKNNFKGIIKDLIYEITEEKCLCKKDSKIIEFLKSSCRVRSVSMNNLIPMSVPFFDDEKEWFDWFWNTDIYVKKE